MTLKTPMLANMRQLSSLDNAWRQGTGRGLERFAIGSQVTSRPLEKGQKRKYKKCGEDGCSAEDCSGGRKGRVYIVTYDKAAKKEEARLEVENRFEDPGRSSLHECIDMGTEGWQLRFFLYHHPTKQIRGTFMPDPPHREHNQFRLGLTDANQNYLKTDAAFLGNAFSGPWGANANLDTIDESRNRLMKSTDTTDHLFQMKYERLAREFNNGTRPFDYGSEEGMQRVFDLAKDHVFKKGPSVKLSRWWRWVDRVDHLLDDFAIL